MAKPTSPRKQPGPVPHTSSPPAHQVALAAPQPPPQATEQLRATLLSRCCGRSPPLQLTFETGHQTESSNDRQGKEEDTSAVRGSAVWKHIPRSSSRGICRAGMTNAIPDRGWV